MQFKISRKTPAIVCVAPSSLDSSVQCMLFSVFRYIESSFYFIQDTYSKDLEMFLELEHICCILKSACYFYKRSLSN
jgi:hypothetical protein